MPYATYLPYLIVMALATYATRALPLTLFRKRVKNRFIRSFLYYVPFAVLAAMTIPGILYATDSMASAAIGLAVAVLLSWFGGNLLTVAVCASAAVYIAMLFGL